MKRCPQCGQTYSQPDINFCLSDGELLMQSQQSGERSGTSGFADDAPPTLVMDSPRVTNPSAWQASPPALWQNPSPAVQSVFGTSPHFSKRDQTLPTISLVLAILSIFLVCCSGGIWLGLPAAVVGFMGMRNVESNPSRYGGRGLAIAGMVIGIVTFLASVVFLIFSVISG